MANTYSKLATYTVGSGGIGSVSFINIPQNYTDLIIKVSVRSMSAGTEDTMNISFNGLMTNYSLRFITTGGGTPASYNRDVFGYDFLAVIPAAAATANTFGNIEMYLANYTSINYKPMVVEAVMENNSSTNYNTVQNALWSNTAPITSIKFVSSVPYNIAQHSTFHLYGIKAEL
jgi:hypothetical protein